MTTYHSPRFMKTHPLTDEIIRKNFTPDYDYLDWDHGEICLGFNNDDLREAADWQLQQVIDWVKSHLDTGNLISEWGEPISESIKKAMRPQQQENN